MVCCVDVGLQSICVVNPTIGILFMPVSSCRHRYVDPHYCWTRVFVYTHIELVGRGYRPTSIALRDPPSPQCWSNCVPMESLLWAFVSVAQGRSRGFVECICKIIGCSASQNETGSILKQMSEVQGCWHERPNPPQGK